MRIVLKNLRIENFKGIKNLSIDFSHETSIYGKNASGKTTVFDAFLYLLFGKDSTDRKDFQLKPLDGQGKPIPKSEVDVSASLIIDGEQVTARRVLKEKWVKKRGELEATFIGNETLYYWNDVPLGAGEYQAKISRIVEENVFKLITNTLYFNSLKWQDRRNVLLTISGGINDNDVAASNPEFAGLMKLLSGKSFAEYKREISTRKKKLKDDLDLLPSRISEVNLAMPKQLDFDALRIELQGLEADLKETDESLINSNKSNSDRNQAIRNKQDEVHRLRTRTKQIAYEIETAAGKSANEIKSQINEIDFSIKTLQQEKSNNQNSSLKEAELKDIEANMATLRTNWQSVNAETFQFTETFQFDEHAATCPTCKQHLPADIIENKKTELQSNFNKSKLEKQNQFNLDKQNRLTQIQKRGGQLKMDADALRAQLETWNARNVEIDNKLIELDMQRKEASDKLAKMSNLSADDLQAKCNQNPEYKSSSEKIPVLETEISEPYQATDNTELRERKSDLHQQINQLRTSLNDELQINKLKDRKAQLEADIKNFAQQIADLEKTEFVMEKFTKAKMDMLERRINGMFKYVTFKLFDIQINGAEVECCDVMINGVPFSDANNAARVNAGVDIINAFSQFHDVYAPIFIDNRESVSDLIETNCQVVNLIVSKPDAQLRVA